jgi:hypothetical protein
MKAIYDWPLQLTETVYPVYAHVKETVNHQIQLVLKTETQYLTFYCQKTTIVSTQGDAKTTARYIVIGQEHTKQRATI